MLLKKVMPIVLLYISFFGISTEIIAQRNYSDSLNLTLTSIFNKSKIPGCALAIINRNGIVYQKSFGYADITNKKDFYVETRTNIASVSKTFISVALMKAIELGYFNLETDINRILPYRVYNPHFPTETIRIRHLVTHTSGIIDYDSVYSKCYRFLITDKTAKSSVDLLNEAGLTGGLKDTTLHDFMFSYLNTKGELYSANNFFNSKPGRRYSYSNIASALVAYLIEIKSLMTFSEFSHRYILTPLKMKQASWFINTGKISNRAIPYYNADTAFPFYTTITYPDGGLVTSVTELSQYVLEMIRSLNYSSSLLNKKSAQRMFKPFFTNRDKVANYDIAVYNNGVFWEVYPDGFVGHPGGDPGVCSFIEFNKEIGIVFLGNLYTDTKDFKTALKKYALELIRQ